MEHKKKNKKIKMNLSDITIDSSLGLLALGDVAFTEWRKVKTLHNLETSAENKEDK